MMTTSRNQSSGHPVIAILTAIVALLPGAAPGQQASVPGVSTLDSEATEEVRQYAVELIIFEYNDRTSAGTEVFLPDRLPEPAAEDDFFAVDPENLEFGDMRETGSVKALDVMGDVLPRDTDFDDETEMPGDQTLVTEPEISSEDMELVEISTYERAGLKLLSREDYVLTDVYKRLVSLDAYRPIMHTAWTQPTLGKEDTLPITVRRLGNPPLRLDGSFSLYLSRFLHLVVNLSLEERSPIRGPAQENRVRNYGDTRSRAGFDPNFVTPTVYYRIEEDRIVRNGELRYYDHPRFGVIAKISRVDDKNSNPGELAPIPNR